jgi:hypothetical protein
MKILNEDVGQRNSSTFGFKTQICNKNIVEALVGSKTSSYSAGRWR